MKLKNIVAISIFAIVTASKSGDSIDVIFSDYLWHLTPTTSCGALTSDVKELCECCLVRQYFASGLKNDLATSQNIVDTCKASRCNDALLSGILEDYFIDSSRNNKYQNLLPILYHNKLAIKPVSFSANPNIFDPNGNFTDAGLKEFFKLAVDEGALISNPYFKNNDNLVIKNLISQGGNATLQLFLLQNSDPKFPQEYIVKESTRREAFRLLNDRYNKDLASLHKYAYPSKTSPVLMLPISTLSYKYNGVDHFVLIMPRAPGVELKKFLNYYVCGQDNDLSRAKEAYSKLGSSFGQFQRNMSEVDASGKILSTFAHGDFHHRNIYYDETNKEVYLIDLENIDKKADYLRDFPYLIYLSNAHPDLIKLDKDLNCPAYPTANTANTKSMWQLITKDQRDKWIYTTTKALVYNYIINLYSEKNKRLELLTEIKNRFESLAREFPAEWTNYQNIIEKAFNAIKIELQGYPIINRINSPTIK